MAIRRKKQTNIFSSVLKFVIAHYLVFIVIACVGIVGIISVYKTYIKKPTYVYAKVKVGQGYWWATTQRPSIWFVKAIQNAKEYKDLGGNVAVKVLDVSYYPLYGSSQFDVYLILRLMVTKSNDTYNFNRESIGVGSPIDLQFSNVQFSGTIIDLKDKPIQTKTVEKIVYLTKKYSFPWEYDEIKVGDYFFNSNEKTIEILDKAKGDINEVLVNDQGKLISTNFETYNYIILKVKVRVQVVDNNFIYAEEIILSPMRAFDFITNRYIFNNFFINKIE